MVGRGGDHRPLSPLYGKDLFYASLLFEHMWNRRSKVGLRFAREHQCLYKRWRRLAKGIIAYRGGIAPMALVEDTEHDIEIMETYFKNRYYPKPRPLTADEQSCLGWRTAIASEASLEIFVNLGRPSDRPQYWDGNQEPWKTWEEVSTFLVEWIEEPSRNANPNVKRKTRLRRDTIVTYRREVSAFCERWRLKAWWAAPAIIQHHFFRADNETVVDQTVPPLGFFAVDPGTPVSHPLTVKLPGRTEEQFELDKTRELNFAETTVVQGDGRPIRVVRSHYSREERAVWEKRNDSSCVLLDWDGNRFLPQGVDLPTMGQSGPPRRFSPADYLVDQCQQRLGRRLKYREEIAIKSQVSKKIREYRSRLRDEGWAGSSDGNIKLVADSVAGLLLTPRLTWLRLTPTGAGEGKNQYGNSQSIARACNDFADVANLRLPTKRPGRVQGSHNTYDPAHR